MQFPRYEQVVPRAGRPMPRHRPPPRPPRIRPVVLATAARLRLRADARRPAGRLDAQEYLRLEFTVEDRR